MGTRDRLPRSGESEMSEGPGETLKGKDAGGNPSQAPTLGPLPASLRSQPS